MAARLIGLISIETKEYQFDRHYERGLFDVFRCPNRSNMAAQISGFSVGFSGGNPEQTVKQPIDLVATSLIREVATKIHGLDRFHGNGPYCNFLTEKEPIRAQGFAEDWLCHIIRCLT